MKQNRYVLCINDVNWYMKKYHGITTKFTKAPQTIKGAYDKEEDFYFEYTLRKE